MCSVQARCAALLVVAVVCAVVLPPPSAGVARAAVQHARSAADALDAGPAAPADRGGRTTTSAAAVTGGPTAHRTGAWSKVGAWPLSAIHAIVLPNGKVMTYGTNTKGRPSYGFSYDIWDPSRGLGADSHTTLPVRTKTNLFCSAQTVLPDGRILITGGEENGAPGGDRNDAVNDVNVFDPSGNTLTRLADEMSYPRWYPTVTALPNGEVLVHGGRDDQPAKTPSLVPEVFSQSNGWRRLPGAASRDVYDHGRWWYPRSWVAPDGNVFIVTWGYKGLWSLDTSGRGAIRELGTYPRPTADRTTPAAMFDVGKILLTRQGGRVAIIDINGATPRVTETGPLASYRSWADATVLADGQVLVSGGASRAQQLKYATRHVEIYDPATGRWRQGPAAAKARLYHSTALLLPDGTVLTAGGGPPGPVTNLNAEIYYPPYLFDASGRLAERPRITGVSGVGYGAAFSVDVADAPQVSRVALIRTGSVTHSFDMDQRHMTLDFEQDGHTLTVQGPKNGNVAPPGRYLLFVFDADGVPSVARIVDLRATAPQVSAAVQTGSLTMPQGRTRRWVPVTFEHPFERTPVVSVGGPSTHSDKPALARVRNVTTHGFAVKLDAWPYGDGRHTFETLSFIAAEPGRHQVGGVTVEAGAVSGTGRWRHVALSGPLPADPVVLPQIASDYDGRAATIRLRDVGRGGFDLRLQGQQADERRGRRHGGETVHYLALTIGRGEIAGRPIQVGLTGRSVGDRWTRVTFADVLATPRLVAAAQTTADADPAAVRYRGLTSRGAAVRMQEERSFDHELRHRAEGIGYVAVGAR